MAHAFFYAMVYVNPAAAAFALLFTGCFGLQLMMLSNETATAWPTKSFSSLQIKPQTKMSVFGMAFVVFITCYVWGLRLF